jgi:alanine dehydrogenase
MNGNGTRIGFPREATPGDRRTLLIPAVASTLREAGFDVLAEPDIGAGISCSDATLAASGVRFVDAEQVWAAPLVLRYRCSAAHDIRRLRPGQSIGALFHAEGDPHLLAALEASAVTAYSYEFVQEADGRFPLATPGGEIAGVQAVLLGSHALQSTAGRGVLVAAVAGAEPANVVVIGCGNVGSAAVRTAAALGARVSVLARDERSANQLATQLGDGVLVLANTPAARAQVLADADLVIGAILVSSYDTPPMITEADLAGMREGSVIVDATCGYGEGYLPTAGAVQRVGEPPRVVGGVLHVKLDSLPSLVPVTASQAFAGNAARWLARLAAVALRGASDPAIEAGMIARAGSLTHPVCQQHAAYYRVSA